ncbi:MAG TPA: ATP-binding protein [Anaeromyxobacter sp.]|nr:ATP-binding protein [Anaeromyxobacter sp.]
MLGRQSSVLAARPSLAPHDERAQATADVVCDRLRRLGHLADAFSACARPEDAARAVLDALELIPARMIRLVEAGTAGAVATAAWPDSAREISAAAHAAAPAHAALACGAPVWLESRQAIVASVDLAAAAAALGVEAWGAIPLGGRRAVLELGLGAPPRVDPTERAYLAVAASIVGGALLAASAEERAARAWEHEGRARGASAEVHDALEALAAGVVVATTSGEIVRMNPAALDLLAIDESEREGIHTVQELLERLLIEWPDGSRVRMAETPFGRARRGEAVRDLVVRFVPEDQPIRWIQASAVPVVEGGTVRHVVVSMVDVTRTRELEQEQRDLVRELFEQVAPPARAIRERANRFVGAAASTPDERSALARDISRESRRLEGAMREIEGALRVDSRSLAPSPELVDLKAFVLDLLEHGSGFDAGRVIVSAPPGLRKAHVDPDHLERILVELVRGALAGAAGGTSVLVACDSVEGAARLTVASSGEEIAPDDAPRLFDRFFRARGRSSGRLYAVRLLAEANRGRVFAECGAGRGLAVHVELPTRAP